MKYITVSLIGILLFNACIDKTSDQESFTFRILPQPKNIELLGGKGLAYGDLGRIRLEHVEKKPVMGEILSSIPMTETGSSKVLTLVLDPDLNEPTDSEGYMMVIEDGNVEIRSTGEAGLFYGCQTLEQLLEDARELRSTVPSCRITDYPALNYRAVHFDVKHHLDHLDYYYKSIDRLARYKINAVIFEVEDKLGFRRQPLVAAPRSISIDEMAALTTYAKDRNIEISPLVQGLGHATFILKHEKYAPLREIPDKRWVFCPLAEGTYEVLFDMYQDAMDATPGSRYLHIGGDEIGDIGICPRCKPMADTAGVMSLNLYWLNRVCKFVSENGRIPVFWDDMPLKQAGVYRSTWDPEVTEENSDSMWTAGEPELELLIRDFPEECVFMRWNYEMGRLPGNIRALQWYTENELPVMVSTAAQTGSMLFPKDERTGSPTDGGLVAIQSFLQVARETGVKGMLCTAWDDLSPHAETYWRGFIAAGEYSWSDSERPLEDYDEVYLWREFGFTEPDYAEFYAKLTRAANFWDGAFMRNGSRTDIKNALINLPGLAHWIPEAEKEKQMLKTDFSDIVIELPDPENPGAWTEKYRDRLIEADEIQSDYKKTTETIERFYRESTKNKYHWELFRALNDFQITAPDLLTALRSFDVPDPEQRKSGMKNVLSALDRFDQSWDNLKSVYSRTRYISYLDNHIPDRYFHYASQREDLGWMIQPEELLHEMIKVRMNNL